VRKLESQGVPTKQAEAITSSITEVLNDSLESISESFVSKAEMQKVIIVATADCYGWETTCSMPNSSTSASSALLCVERDAAGVQHLQVQVAGAEFTGTASYLLTISSSRE
jgi:hypothetical protein